MSEETASEAVAKISKEARLEERKLIEDGLDRRQKVACAHDIEITKLRAK